MLNDQVQNDIGDETSWKQSYKHLLCGHLEPNIVGQVLVMWPWPRISGLRKWVIIVDNYLNSLFHVVKTNDIMYTLQSMVTTTSTCMLGVGVIRVFSVSKMLSGSLQIKQRRTLMTRKTKWQEHLWVMLNYMKMSRQLGEGKERALSRSMT